MIDHDFDALSRMHADHRAEVAALTAERDRYRLALECACGCIAYDSGTGAQSEIDSAVRAYLEMADEALAEGEKERINIPSKESQIAGHRPTFTAYIASVWDRELRLLSGDYLSRRLVEWGATRTVVRVTIEAVKP